MNRLVARLALALLVAACGKGRARPEPAKPEAGPPAPAPEAERTLDEVEEDLALRAQFDEVMYRKLYAHAVDLRKAMRLPEAAEAADAALRHRPTSEEALRLRAEIARMRGDRGGETETVIDDAYESYRVRLDEQKVAVRRHLADGRRAMDQGDFAAALRAYENAAFIVATSRYAPLGGDNDLARLGEEAEKGAGEARRREAEQRVQRERADTEAALREAAAQEEQEALRGRDRRAKLLNSAIDRFNLEDFEGAQGYASQVLAEEPDNTLARDVLDNARRSRHGRHSVEVLRELMDSYRRWQVDIERTRTLQGRVLVWPAQSFWDRITRIRGLKSAGAGGRALTPEERLVSEVLDQRQIEFQFDGTPFPQVVNYLTASTGLNFVVDARAREDLSAVEVSLIAESIPVRDGLTLLMGQVSSGGEVVWEITGNVVRFLKREHQKRNLVLRIHTVADLTLGLVDFIPPQITQLGVSDDSDAPLFGGQGEEAPQPYGTIEELMELVRGSIGASAWEDPATITSQGKNLVVYQAPEVQDRIARFLDDLRSFAGIAVNVETRFLSVGDAFLRDFGVDFRGLGGANGGPLAALDDVTSGLEDSASAGIDNGAPGVNAGGAATAPASGFFFNDGGDGDFRGRSENIYGRSLGQTLSALGGGTFQVSMIDDFSLSMVIRATEKTARVREMTAPSLTVYNTQRANLSVLNQVSFVQDFDVEVAQTAFIADPVIGIVQDGIVLDVRPTVSNDRQFVTLEMRPTVTNLLTPISTFQTLLGAAGAPGAVLISAQNPVTIQLPEIDLRSVETTVRLPDRGSLLLGGLKTIRIADKKATTPILGNIPVVNLLFSRQGKSQEMEHLMIIVTATIIDLHEEAERLRH